MGTPAVGVKLMLVSTGWPSRTAARLAPLPRWARMTRALRRVDAGHAFQFAHEVSIGQSVNP